MLLDDNDRNQKKEELETTTTTNGKEGTNNKEKSRYRVKDEKEGPKKRPRVDHKRRDKPREKVNREKVKTKHKHCYGKSGLLTNIIMTVTSSPCAFTVPSVKLLQDTL